MKNVTEYLKENGIYNDDIIRNFLRMQRVKYLMARGETVESKCGRHGAYTLFSEGLFEIFQSWMRKEPLPLLNRKEYEVEQFITEFFGDEVKRQYQIGAFIYDWFVPSLNLLIEFNEKEHLASERTRNNDLAKMRDNLFVINEATVMQDLAKLAKLNTHAPS